MAKRITKDELFRQALDACEDTFHLIDLYFLDFPNNGEDGLTRRILNIDPDHPKDNDKQVASDAFRKAVLWARLDTLYNYSVDGMLPKGETPEDVVNCGEEALILVSHAKPGFSKGEGVLALVSTAHGRFAFDRGEDIELTELALLANVDERTVRNAISVGELKASSGKPVIVDNQTARSWLLNRRGYRPTQELFDASVSMAGIKTPTQFGAFMKFQYDSTYPDSERGSVMPMHSAIGADTLVDLEAGVFNLPLDVCSVLADFYQLNRQLFLITVMEVFYGEELCSLRQTVRGEERGSS